ncbi:MAG: hypothetical protein H3C43_08965 [Leptonema sp. (in: Bacteria)]|nr:hypothetical protein [Leptonema sp. (in: bacteria)]
MILALNSGLGHRTRMERLQIELQNRNVSTKLQLVDQDFQILNLIRSDQNQLIVIDCRDVDLSIDKVAYHNASIIAIDNLNQNRFPVSHHIKNKLMYYDTLPHPMLDESFHQIMNQILLDDQLLKQKTGNQNRICFYAGPKGFLSDQTILTVDKVFQNSPNYIQIGGNRPTFTRTEYLNLLAESKWLITYPGMSFYESLYLNVIPILIETESEVHDSLSRYLVNKFGCLYVTNETLFSNQSLNQMLVDDQMVLQSLDLDLFHWRNHLRSKSGIKKLADRIEESYHGS